MKKNSFPLYLLKFILGFCILYYGTIAYIGITTPGGFYISAADKYFNYVAWLRASLLYTAKGVLWLTGYDAFLPDAYTLRLKNGSGVHIGYDCIGYGVLSFWIAFIVANQINSFKKWKWLVGGVFLIWVINVCRIFLMVIAVNRNWELPAGLDNHTIFNIMAYLAIFTMIFFFDRSEKLAA